MLIRHARHGEPANPREGNLTELGIRQAEATGDLLGSGGLERLFSSPYPRAMQTASIISRKAGLPVEVRVDLHNKVRPSERIPSRAKLESMYPRATFPPDMAEDWSPGEENGKDVYARLGGEVGRLRSLESSHERMAVVSHAFTLDVLASILAGCPPKTRMRFWFDNCSLTLISSIGGVGRVHYLNLVGHLQRRDLFF
jgi:broad specificity phosphatase PhoE